MKTPNPAKIILANIRVLDSAQKLKWLQRSLRSRSRIYKKMKSLYSGNSVTCQIIDGVRNNALKDIREIGGIVDSLNAASELLKLDNDK